MAFEIVGTKYEGGIFVKTSADGRSWGDPADIGAPVRTAEGYQLTNGPYITWTPAGGDEGTALVSGKTLRDSDGRQAPGSGRTLLVTTDLSEFDSWTTVSAPLEFEDAIDVDHETVGWTTPLLPSRDDERLLRLTSPSVEGERYEISYASGPLTL